MMIKDSFQSADGLKLYTQHWPLDDPQAVILIVHGLGEHIGRYDYVAAALNAANYAALGLDHRGHGHSEGQPRATVRSMDVFVDDLEMVWEQAKQTYPNKPIFVLGHSMGAQIGLLFTLRHQDQLQGFISSGIPLHLSPSLPSVAQPLFKLVNLVSKLSPAAGIAAPIDSALLSHDPDICSGYDADPLVYHGKVTLGMAAALIGGERDALSRLQSLSLPLLILHGEADQVVDPQGSHKLYNQSASADKTLHIWPELYHEIFNETIKDELISTVIAWLNAHLPA